MDKYIFSDAERALMEGSEVPFAIYQFIDKRVVTLILSKGFCDLFGYAEKAEAYYDMDNDMYRDTHRDDAARIADAAFRFAVDGGKYDVIYRTKKPSGDGYMLVHAQGVHTYTETGVRLAYVWYISEGSYEEGAVPENDPLTASISNALHSESFIKASYYDHLTSLPSMTYFFELAELKRLDIRSSGSTPALVYTDFSGMKYYNHKHGFAEGDRLLQSFARVLAVYFGNENCCRIGQDHFAVITENEGLEQRLKGLFEDCRWLNDEKTLPLHVGIYNNWPDGIITSMACDRAKLACDSLSSTFSSEFSYYDTTMKEAEDKQQYIIANLDKAIEERWIKVFYQPIVRAVNGRVCDEEALARWFDPVMGFMSPGDFIPILEEHRLIYKLDLYVVDCVLIKIKTLEEAGLNIMPQSVNLSRSDFDTCDIVDEVCKRVDAAGISRSMITIEITESMIGKDFEFMKSQIERFRENGFAVWMDDFGSGYSSLDVLQSVTFDLIKFDMRFMMNFNSNNRSRIILTELIDMATALGIDTVCEGVETEDQVRFLREAGCSKLQGYYFDKPVPVERIIEKNLMGIQIGFEDPDESPYYEAVGRVNLHDLSVISEGNVNGLDNIFKTIPVGILELKGDDIRVTRSNKSYREFMLRFFGVKVDVMSNTFRKIGKSDHGAFKKAIKLSASCDNTLFFNDRVSDSKVVYYCLRRIIKNTKSGFTAIAAAVLSINDSRKGTNYSEIAKALAADYLNLYYVNIENDTFIEYSQKAGSDVLDIERHGNDFFRAARNDALKAIYSADRDAFIAGFTKEKILAELDRQDTLINIYRLMVSGEPVYVSMKIMRMQQDSSHIIIGVRNNDAFMQQKVMIENMRRNKLTYDRIMALSGDYICMYTVDPATDDYYEYSASDEYRMLGLAKSGSSFFDQAHKNSLSVVVPEDQQKFAEMLTKKNIMDRINSGSIFELSYRMHISGQIIPVGLKAALVDEEDGTKIIIGVYKLHG